MSEPQTITTLGELLAHALELEQESVERYRELADSMETHNNPKVAELFRQLAEYSQLHAREVQERSQGLVLGRGGNVHVNRQVSKEDFNFEVSHFTGVAFVMKENIAFYPIEISFLGAVGVMFNPHGVAHLVQQLWFCR